MVDLRTRYLGLELAHPIVASASPLSKDEGGVKRLEDGGAAAVVMASLFEEQLRHEAEAVDYLAQLGADSHGEAADYFPKLPFAVGPERYLELLRRAREAVRVPVIASLNGVTNEGWIDYAHLLQQAGAAAIELNVYHVAADFSESGAAVEQRYFDILRAVKSAVSIPVAMKLGPFFSAFGHLAKRLDEAGVDGLVLFNRFYQPDFDLERMEAAPSLELSSPSEIRLPLRWIAMLHGRLKASLAATTGVHSATEVVKYLLAGADAVMSTSAVLRHGPGHLGALRDGLEQWLEQRGYASVAQMRGAMSQRKVKDPAAFERANYVQLLEHFRNPYST